MEEFKHIPVMLEEVILGLNINPNGIYIDCTLGGGGHSEEILKKLNQSGKLIGLDKDKTAILHTTEKLKKYPNFSSYHIDFKQVQEVVDYLELYERIDGVLIDLGVSSYQIDTGSRGFSFLHDGPLDMRMNQESDFSAYNVVNEYSYEKLCKILFEYGEEEFAKKIAQNIINAREIKPIKTTLELAKIIENSLPQKVIYKRGGAHKKAFQAIRIEVNKELENLYETIQFLAKNLKKGGRIAILTFHSLEDRIVKNAFKDLACDCICPPKTPVCICNHRAVGRLVNKKPIIASQEEQHLNSRSTCAKLRVLERI